LLALAVAGLAALGQAPAAGETGAGGAAGWSAADGHPGAVCQLPRLEARHGRPVSEARRVPGSADGLTLAAALTLAPPMRPPLWRRAPVELPIVVTGRGVAAGRSCRGPPAAGAAS